MRTRDTIYALSSGSPPSAIAVLRVSGDGARGFLEARCGGVPLPRQAVLRTVRDRVGASIDQGIILFFPGPNSYTGEDSVEFQLHGGRAVVLAMLQCLADFGFRHAEAGEFSRRAFDHGKLDLVEIEALADLIAAETEMQRRLAIDQSGGKLSQIYLGWAKDLTRARAWIEAELDFPEEEDIPGAVSDRALAIVAGTAEQIRKQLSESKSAEVIRDGYKIVIAGRPNSGKSSLLNTLSKRQAAIVTSIAGTTRDIVAVDLDMQGFLVKLIDTAGLREAVDVVEAEGIRRARVAAKEADLVLLLKEYSDTGADEHIEVNAPVIHVRTKSDLATEVQHGAEIWISTETGRGIDSLTKRILELVTRARVHPGQALIVRQRQIDILSATVGFLESFLNETQETVEIRAEYLRRAGHSLGRLTGFVDTEELLGVIFSEFCVGK